MKKLFFSLMLAIVFAGCSASRFSSETDQFKQTIQQIDNIFNDSAFEHAHWGAFIKSLDSDKIWYKRNSNKVFMPASNQKILTSAAALIELGPDFKFTTNFNLVGEIKDSVLYGDLIIIANGDPTLYTRFFDSPIEVFKIVTDSLKNYGIKTINGNIIGDDNIFDDQHLGNGWSYDYLDSWYAAPVGALQLNENYIDLSISPSTEVGELAKITHNIETNYIKIINELVTTDTGENYIRYNRPFGTNDIKVWGRIKNDSYDLEISPSIENPTKFYVTVFSETLKRGGIKVSGMPLDCDEVIDYKFDSNNAINFYTHNSPPLKDILKILMKRSQNLYAETMVRILGAEFHNLGSFRNGREVLQNTYQTLGIDSESYSYADGSGLTRYNFISPEQIVTILSFMYCSEFKNIWLDMQPLAGVDGTLRGRMKGTFAEANVKAKTGTISNVRGLSGYVQTKDGENIVFSFLVNGHLLTAKDTERITDKVLELIAGMKSD